MHKNKININHKRENKFEQAFKFFINNFFKSIIERKYKTNKYVRGDIEKFFSGKTHSLLLIQLMKKVMDLKKLIHTIYVLILVVDSTLKIQSVK